MISVLTGVQEQRGERHSRLYASRLSTIQSTHDLHRRAVTVAAIALAAAGACDATGDETATTARRCLTGGEAVADAPSGSECDWPQAGRSPRRTGYNDGESVLSPETVGGLVEAWAVPIEDESSVDSLARPVVWRGSVFATAGQELVSLDAETGAPRWGFTGQFDHFVNAPAVSAGHVHATNIDALMAFDAETGAELWRVPPAAFDYNVSAPLVSGFVTLVTAHRLADPDATNVHAIAATTGEQLWNNSVSGANVARRAAAADERFYMAMPSSEILAVRTFDGVEQWVHAFADGQVGSPAVSRGVVVMPWVQCCADLAQAIQAVDAETGAPAWTADLACTLPLDFSPVVDGTRVYVACDAPGGGVEIVALSLETGAVEMDVTVGDGTLSGELSGANGVLYVGATDGFLRALDASTGAELLAIELGAPMSQPAIANGRVLIGAGSTVHALALPD